MNVNTTFLKINQNENKHWHIVANNELGDKLDTYLSDEEFQYAKTCMNGTAAFYPFFDDINYLSKFTPSGIRLVVNNRDHKDCWFIFPMRQVLESLMDDNTCVEFDEDTCKRVKFDCTPRPKWEYHDLTGYSVTIPVKSSLEQWYEFYGLNDCLDKLWRIACNYSDGIYGNAVIHIQLDSMPVTDLPDSYYFYILDAYEKKIMNGGVIFHPNYDENNQWVKDEHGIVIGSYSIHT